MTDLLDLGLAVSQRAASWRFDLLDRTLQNAEPLDVVRDDPPSMRVDTGRSVKRTLDNLSLPPGVIDDINVVSDRLRVTMLLQDGTEWPMGVYLFASSSRSRFTGLIDEGSVNLTDQCVIVDQQVGRSVGFGPGRRITDAIEIMLNEAGVTYNLIDSGAVITPQEESVTWEAGTSRLKIINDLCAMVGYHELYFDNFGVAQVGPMPNPDSAPPEDVLSHTHGIVYGTLTRSSDLLELPNRFVVVNGGATNTAVRGIYDLPDRAPHSAANRGFIISHVESMQGIENEAQAKSAARALARDYRWAHETVEFSTPPDPRHDHYDVVDVDDERNLELSWSMTLTEGSDMRHTARRTYEEDEVPV